MPKLCAKRSWLWLVLATLGVADCQRCGHAPGIEDHAPAHLFLPKGTVSVTPPGEGQSPHPGATGEALQKDAEVTTASDGSCDIVFSGNVVVHLGPSSELLVRDAQGGTQADVGAIVLKGSMRISAPAGAEPLQIKTPMGVAQIGGAELSVMDVTFEHGVQVATGQISLKASTTAAPVTLGAGQSMTVAGLSGISPEISGLNIGLEKTQTPLNAAIARAGRNSRHRQKSSAWQKAERGQAVRKGDEVAAGKDDAAEVQLGEHMRVSLADGAAMTVVDTDNSDPNAPKAHLGVAGGRAELSIAPGMPKAAQLVEVDRAPVELTAPVQRAELTTEVDSNDGAALYVRYGAAKIGDAVVPAGFVAKVSRGKLDGEPTPAFPDAIEARASRSTEIYYDESPPPVAFVWKSEGAVGAPSSDASNTGHDIIEMSQDEGFARDLRKERGVDGRFAIDKLDEGVTYFRAGDKKGALKIIRDGSQICDECRSVTELSDTGESVDVSYEQIEPRIVLSWSKSQGVGKYRVRLAAKDAIGSPIVDKISSDQSETLPDNALTPGSYVWWVEPAADAQKLPKAAQLNEFTLSQDKTVDAVAIKSPKKHANVRAARVKVSGQAAARLHITINGKPTVTDQRGNFVTYVPLNVGHNRIVIGASGAGSADQYYVRNVFRRP